MVLNYIWVSFFVIAFLLAFFRLIFLGDTQVFTEIFQSTIDASKLGFEISIGLTGVLTFWLGIVKIGEKGGMVKIMYKLVGPFFRKLFPEIPKNHPVLGPLLLNLSANMLNLDNAATPLGLKAMEGLQELNPNKDQASDAQIMFLVLNTSGLTIIPINIMVYRAQMGAANPADIFLPILLATFFSTLAGLVAVSFYQKINLFDKVILIYLGSITAFIGFIIFYFTTLDQARIQEISQLSSHLILFSLIIGMMALGIRKKNNLYDDFIEGAKEGFSVAIKIIPYLIAILVGIAVFRTSGAMDYLVSGIAWTIGFLGFNTDFVAALPTALMKPLSGGGARGMMIDTMETYGADSFAGRVASVFQGSTETTFYVLALYFGSVNIKNTRYAVTCGLIADFAGVVAAIFLSYLFFH
ncbi:MAG: spore maturation protein [Cyclobacteriaceae bacterium]|nr:spore maturation protein [Cyclobacteriaceae bacterium]